MTDEIDRTWALRVVEEIAGLANMEFFEVDGALLTGDRDDAIRLRRMSTDLARQECGFLSRRRELGRHYTAVSCRAH